MYTMIRKLFFPCRTYIYKSKGLSLLYLGCHAWLPILFMYLVSLSLVFSCPKLFDNSGALLVCGALLAELLYFHVPPEWRNVVKFLGSGFVSITKDKAGEKAAFYIGPKLADYEHINSQGKITDVSGGPPVVSYDLKSEINELDLLKMFYRPEQFGDSPHMIQPSIPMRHIDSFVAQVIGLTAFVGTIIWGFGDPSAW